MADELITFKLNNQPARLTVDPERMLLWVLRTELGLTGTKFGCGQSLCGACTVLLDDEPVRSCRVPMKEVRNRHVFTIEGLSAGDRPHPLQQAFLEHTAYQCGFCTPGMILGAHSLLLKNPKPTRTQVIEAMEGHLCRCGSYARIIRAIQSVAAAKEERRPV